MVVVVHTLEYIEASDLIRQWGESWHHLSLVGSVVQRGGARSPFRDFRRMRSR
jgi:hypothetical protein